MSGTDRVLLIEDKADDCRLMTLILRERLPHCTVDVAGDAVSFAEQLAGGGFSVAVVSQDLTWADASQALTALRRHHPRCRLFMLADQDTWPQTLLAEQRTALEVLPRTSGGLLALPERIRTSICRSGEETAEESSSREPPPGETLPELRTKVGWPEPANRTLPPKTNGERSREELEELAYALSHDLLGTVHLLSQYAGLLQERYQGRLDTEADRYLGHLLSSSERLQGMIDAVLEYLRSGRQDTDSGPVDFGGVVTEAVRHLGAVVEEVKARIEWNALPTLASSRHQMVQLFQNLLANAIKFRREAPPHIEITAEEHANEWKFAIKDNGAGIDTDNQQRIFGLFHTIGTSAQSQGKGIGLAMCKRIVERHGGRIWVESRLGEGSSFYFTIAKRG